MEYASFSELLGHTLTGVTVDNTNDVITFVSSTGIKFILQHEQNCCETVVIESVTGNIVDLIGTPITMAVESSNSNDTDDGTETWTFYKLATAKGYVDIRWHGSSNGYYSESVSFTKQ